ncbi:SdpI family protein [Ruminococcus sp. OA3]|uniref:SdpI family protein n=1 Tax=Ruminococcus sp. OA3 TaxID=2914164 RepID=UPI001F069E41|nr:SdpI family protein [Ruminococcus sp. OA3]MCH1982615.1 SdpI family protein [Ruminococcus sp. OA3]
MFAFLFICSLLVPLSMTLLGKRWSEKPPADIQGLSGYRTAMAKLNQDTWCYAHKIWGRMCFVIGIILIIGTIAFLIYIRNYSNFETLVTYWVFTQIVILALTVIPTEIQLKKVFTKTGQRK